LNIEDNFTVNNYSSQQNNAKVVTVKRQTDRYHLVELFRNRTENNKNCVHLTFRYKAYL